jgi:hypothetical protein
MQSEPGDVTRPRLYRNDVMHFKSNIAFEGEERECQTIITAYGDKFKRLLDLVMLAHGKTLKNPHKLYQKIYSDFPALHHGDRILSDHIQVNLHHCIQT